MEFLKMLKLLMTVFAAGDGMAVRERRSAESNVCLYNLTDTSGESLKLSSDYKVVNSAYNGTSYDFKLRRLTDMTSYGVKVTFDNVDSWEVISDILDYSNSEVTNYLSVKKDDFLDVGQTTGVIPTDGLFSVEEAWGEVFRYQTYDDEMKTMVYVQLDRNKGCVFAKEQAVTPIHRGKASYIANPYFDLTLRINTCSQY